MAEKIDKFTFACDSRHSESCLNVTFEPWLSSALKRAYSSQRKEAEIQKGSGKCPNSQQPSQLSLPLIFSPSKNCIFLVVMAGIIVNSLIS